MNKKFLAPLFAAALSVASYATEVSPITVTLTNSLAANATTTANLGSVVDLRKWDSVGLQLKFTGIATNAGNLTVSLARSVDGSNWETTPLVAWVVALDSTNSVIGYTNFSVQGISYLKVASIANSASSANVATNASLVVLRKRTD